MVKKAIKIPLSYCFKQVPQFIKFTIIMKLWIDYSYHKLCLNYCGMRRMYEVMVGNYLYVGTDKSKNGGIR